MTPHHALQLAMKAERGARDFYAGVAGRVDDPVIRAAAEEFAEEEAEHVAELERWLERYPDPGRAGRGPGPTGVRGLTRRRRAKWRPPEPPRTEPLPGPRYPLLRWLIALLLPVLLVAWVSWAVGWKPLLSAWTSMPADTLALAVALVALSYLARALRVYDYFIEETRGRFPATLRLSLLHNTANNLLPMRAGEMAFPLLMKRYFGQSLARSGLSLFWIRLLDLHLVGLVALIALYLDRRTTLYLLLPAAWIAGLALAIWAVAGCGETRRPTRADCRTDAHRAGEMPMNPPGSSASGDGRP